MYAERREKRQKDERRRDKGDKTSSSARSTESSSSSVRGRSVINHTSEMKEQSFRVSRISIAVRHDTDSRKVEGLKQQIKRREDQGQETREGHEQRRRRELKS